MPNNLIKCECNTHVIEIYNHEDSDLTSLIFWHYLGFGKYPFRIVLRKIWQLIRDQRITVSEIIISKEEKEKLIQLLK